MNKPTPKRTGRATATPQRGRHADVNAGAASRWSRCIIGTALVVVGACVLTLANTAQASCGDYLHVSDNPRSPEHHSSDTPRPCHGPMCSKTPNDHYFPPPAPRRVSQHQQDALAYANHPPALAKICGLVPPDSDALPSFASDRIFRPPRCCCSIAARRVCAFPSATAVGCAALR